MKEKSEKVGLKLNIQKTKIMASGPITSWQIDGETMETVTEFTFLGSKITVVGEWNHEIKKTFAPWKKSYDQPRQHIKKQRYYFANKGLSSQSYGFSSSHVWIYALDNKGWARRINAFELWCWRRLLRVPWTARRSNLKEISPEISLEGLMLKLKLQHWPPDAKNRLTGKDPDAGKGWRQEKRGMTEDEMIGWHHQLDGYEF